jgi:hypothetical protein
MQEMNKPIICALLWILLFTNPRYADWSEHTSVSSSSNEYAERALDWQSDGLSTTNPGSKSPLPPARGLIERWCAAYGRLDEKELAALESPNIEIVDRFGELHVAKQRSDEEHFWSEGFEMIRRADFHPLCHIAQIRATRSDVSIVHADITYPGGIPLKGGDYIPAFSEIHTFIVLKHEAVWQIAEHDITRRALP